MQAPDDDLINARELPLVAGKGALVWIVAGSVIFSTALLALLLWWSVEKRK